MAVTSRGQSQSKAADAQHYVEYDEYVDYQLEKTRSIVKRTDILTTVTTLAAAMVAYLFAFVVFDQWIIAGGFGYASRVTLLGLVLALVGGTVVWRVLLPLLRRVHPLYAARVIERSDPQFQSNLVNFVDVKLSNAASVPVVLKSMQKRAAVELSHIDVEEAVDHRPLLRVAYALLAVVIVAAAYIIWSPKDTFTSVKRAFGAIIEVATETTIRDVTPDDDSDVPARTVVTIEADVKGKDADRAQILYTTTDHKYVDQIVEMRRIDPNLPRFRGLLNGENGRGLLQSLTYRIVAGDARTREYVVNVIQPPGARVDEVHYVFPAYMQFEEKTTAGGDIDGWDGAFVTVKATANVPVKNAYVILTDTEGAGDKGEEHSMQVTDGTKLSASWKLEFRPDGTAAGFYHIQVETAKKERDPDPTHFTYRVRADQRPDVALLAPAGDLTMPANGVIPLVIQASDPDFQLRSMTLKVEKGGEAIPDQRLFEDRELGQSFRGTYDFRLAPLQLTPGENILFWIEVKDNKAPTANRANTPRIKVEIGKPVTTAEAQKLLAEEKLKQQAELDKARDAANLDDTAKQPPRDSKDEPQPEDSQQPKDRAQPGDEKQADRKQLQKKRVQEGPPDDVAGDAADQSDRKQHPGNDEEMLQRLLKKLQNEDQPGDKSDSRPLPTDDEKSKDQHDSANSDRKKADRGQGSKAGQKSDQSDSKKDQSQTKENSQSDSQGADDKTLVDDPKRTRDDAKKQQGADTSQADKNQSDKKRNADNKTGDNKLPPPPSADEKNQNGDKGPSSDKKDAGKKDGGKKNAGDKPGDSPNPTDSKPKSKTPADEKKNDAGKEAGDKSNDAKKAGDGARKDDDSPNEKSKDKPGQDGAGNDKDGQDDAANENAEKGDTGKQDDGKNDDGKKDMKKDGDSPQDKAPSDDKAATDDKPATDQKKQAQGGAGQKDAAESDPASNSKDQSKAKGSPGKSDKPEGDKQSGDSKGGDKSNKQGDGPAKNSDDANPTGKEEPADDDPAAKKKKATGDETGEASGNEEADPDATKANNDLKKKPGSQDGVKKTSDDSSTDGKKSNQKRQPQEGTKKGSSDAENADRAPDGKGPTEKTDEVDEPPSERGDKKSGGENEKRPGQPPDAGNRDMKGDGRKPGQKSDQPETGEKGGSAATDQGKPGANKPGAGDKGTDGNTDPTKQKTGQPGDQKKGPGSTTKPSDDGEGQKKDGPGDEAGNKDSKKDSKNGAKQDSPGKTGDQGEKGDGGDKPGDNKGQANGKASGQKSGDGKKGSGDSGSKPGDSKGDSKGESNGQPGKPGKPGAGQQQSGSGISAPPAEGDPGNEPGAADDANAAKPGERSTDEPNTAEEDEANLEAARKATNLVLQRLKSQLERGEVDQEMMDELGWKDRKDVEKFVKYLEKGMAQKDDDNSPQAEARRMQFEETLRGMNLGNETQRRTGSVGKERAIEQIGAKNAPVPREYQKVWESYTRSLSKQGDKGDGKGQEKVLHRIRKPMESGQEGHGKTKGQEKAKAATKGK